MYVKCFTFGQQKVKPGEPTSSCTAKKSELELETICRLTLAEKWSTKLERTTFLVSTYFDSVQWISTI